MSEASIKLPVFTEVICPERRFCGKCRSNAEWRASAAKHYEMPKGGIEICPFGVDKPDTAKSKEPIREKTRQGDCGCTRAKRKAAIATNEQLKAVEPTGFPTNIAPAVPFVPIQQRLKFTNGDTPVALANLYRGKSAFLICGGPSFGKLDSGLLNQPGILTCAINNSVASYRPHIWVHGDGVDHFIRSAFFDPTIMKFTPTLFKGARVFDSDKWQFTDCTMRDCPPNQFFYERSCGFNAPTWLESDKVVWGNEGKNGSGRSTMYAAIRILWELGIRTIYLLGVDFDMTKEQQYHFEQKKDQGAQRSNNDAYGILARRFVGLKPHLDAAGLRIFNCNPTSKLTVFPFMPFTDAVQAAKDEFGVDVAHERTEGLYTTTKPPAKPIVKALPVKKPDPPLRRWGDPLPAGHPKIFSHANHAGDLIYSLPTIKAMGGGRLHIVTGRGITEQIAKSLVTLCSKQPYITEVTYSPNVEGVDMSHWKNGKGGLNLTDQHLGSFGLPPNRDAWLTVENPIITTPVVIHRSPRYHNDLFPWAKVVEKYQGKITFVGQEHEHKTFCQKFGQVPYLYTQDYLHLARVIAGCELFIGNQSSPYAVAEGMKKPTVQETCLKWMNCIWDRPGATYGKDGNVVLPDLKGQTSAPPPRWRQNPKDGPCIVTGADRTQQDLMPFFISNLRKFHPDIPLVIADFGMERVTHVFGSYPVFWSQKRSHRPL